MNFTKKVSVFLMLVSLLLPINVYAENNPASSSVEGMCISLRINNNDIWVNGELKALKDAPFVENNFAYVPLREVVELCGGIVKYIPYDQSVMIAMKKGNNETCFSQIWIGKSRVLNDGHEEAGHRHYMSPNGSDNDFIPILKNGRVFIPADYFNCFSYAAVWNTDNDRIIINSANEHLGVGEFRLGQNFNLLDERIKKSFTSTGRIDYQYQTYKEEVFTNGEIELSLATGGYLNNTPNVIEIRKIVIFTDKYCTQRGLRVGDSEEKHLALYDSDNLMHQFDVETSMGKVTKIILKATA